MTTYILVSLILIISAFVYIKIAEKYNIVDRPNHRSSHTEPIIRGAGVLFYIAAFIFFVVSNFSYPYLIIGLSIIALISYIDDLMTLSSKVRLVFQFISISLLLYQLVLILELPIYVLPILLIIGVGFINVFNFMDGINGITGLYSLVAFFGLYLINRKEEILDERFIVFMIISIIIFGYFNFRKKARFFCGDVGSISLAIILLFMITYFSFKLESPLIVLLMGVYLTDAVFTIFYRKAIGENIVEAHRHHIYQKLTDIKKYPHLKTSLLYAILQSLIILVILFSYNLYIKAQLLIFVCISLTLVLLYIFLFKWLKKVKD